jgi:hypothetical protein
MEIKPEPELKKPAFITSQVKFRGQFLILDIMPFPIW